MRIKKLFTKAEAFLDSDKRKRREKKKCLKHVLKKLRNYEEKLNAQLRDESDKKAAEKLNREIALVHAQRKKGLRVLKNMK